MTRDETFGRLMDEVERQGGAHLPGICKPRKIEYRSHKTTLDGVVTEFKRVDPIDSTGCNRERRFVIPDLPRIGDNEPKTTVACMDDDALDLWPRFSSIHPDA